MKKLIIGAMLIVLALGLAACRRAQIDRDVPLDLSLQNIELVEIYYNPSLKGSVAVDRQTGVMYWFSHDGIATALVDEYGNQRLWRGGR